MVRLFPWWLSASLIAVLTACGGRSSPKSQPVPRAAPGSDATLSVENRGFSDMTIYIVGQSERVRLGVATGNSVAKFKIRNEYIGHGPVRFLADPIGGTRAPVSQELDVNPGDEVTLMIPPS